MFNRRKDKPKKPAWREYLEAILWAVVLALLIRTWGVQAFKIPSGSMIPTLLIGDHLLVSKSSYGFKNPFTDKVLIPMGEPQRGDVVVFRFPEDKDKDFIKRIMGLPGEIVQVKGKTVYINGKPVKDPWGHFTDRTINPTRDDFGPVKVPQNKYFVMGDNRDQSYDSRFWFNRRGGFVPKEDILGKAFIIYWSWEGHTFGVRLGRVGDLIN
ncbi:signal peptidase I [Dethiosulfatarculus sandiegensis]|uniref:Signal peptidase I n=1 Tax=Dethiosulfatarculus sandiegensis TaxID=1429043 RepID=A0A0D2J5X8_9BACT|nr:signal peptidase I [Dethiosulfatarculus sandiegensis]KIX13489.1 signal peptidase I [Dethiosulfatarculus sandiegensis]